MKVGCAVCGCGCTPPKTERLFVTIKISASLRDRLLGILHAIAEDEIDVASLYQKLKRARTHSGGR